MYGTIPDVVISKPRNNQFRVVVALGVGVLIGALGTAMLTPAPTAAHRPILKTDYYSDIEWVPTTNRDDIARECESECMHQFCDQGKEGKSSCESSCENIYERLLAHE